MDSGLLPKHVSLWCKTYGMDSWCTWWSALHPRRLCNLVWYMQAALQQQAQEKKKKPPAVPRAAGGEKWWDPTLVEWPKDDFRFEALPSPACPLCSSGSTTCTNHHQLVSWEAPVRCSLPFLHIVRVKDSAEVLYTVTDMDLLLKQRTHHCAYTLVCGTSPPRKDGRMAPTHKLMHL